MTRVELRDGESQESLLRRFRKKVSRARVLSEVKKRRFFVSKSAQRRAARRKAVRREHRRQRKQNGRHRR